MEPTNNTWIYRLPETIPWNPPAIPGCMDYLKLLHGTLLQYLDIREVLMGGIAWGQEQPQRFSLNK